jgi:hypothetical protein
MENEQQRLMDTNEVGFYLNSRMGLAFSQMSLETLLACCKKFKNSVFIVYDISKSNYGMQPLHAYRLSEKANATIASDSSFLAQHLIKSKGLSIAEFFEEIPIKIQRSHMQQAYLFDYIQPEMPAFNTNVFKLCSSNYLCNHVHSAMEITEQLNNVNKDRLEKLQNQVLRMKRNKSERKKEEIQNSEAEANKVDYFLMSKQVDSICE